MSDDVHARGDRTVPRGEFDKTMVAVKRDLDRIEDAVADVRQTARESLRVAQKSLRVAQATLTTVQSIEGRLKDMDDHGERLKRLEDKVLASGGSRFEPRG